MNIHCSILWRGRYDRPNATFLRSEYQESTYPLATTALYSTKSFITYSGRFLMAASQVVLYFDKPEDALLFTLAASSVIASDEPARTDESAQNIAKEISKATRITTEGSLTRETGATEPRAAHCA
jgi:hypothetical protein